MGNINKEKEYQREYREKNKDKRKEYLKLNRESVLKYKKTYRDKNKDKIKIRSKQYYDNNQDKIKIYRKGNKEKYNLIDRNRRKIDPLYKLRKNIRTNITGKFKQNGYTKKSKLNEILGCSFDELKLHLETQFEDWQNWGNHGLYNGKTNYGWDIDHIIPISSAKTEEEVIRLNHYTNLQPLCSYINRDIKKDKI